MIPKILITGCYGFIGSNVALTLCGIPIYKNSTDYIDIGSGDYDIIGIDTDSYISQFSTFQRDKTIRQLNACNNFSYIHSDINNLKSIPHCDFVINFAAHTHVDNSLFTQKDFIHSNILGVENILQLIKSKHDFDKPILIHLSSDEVYGDENIPKDGFTENDKLNPSNPYSATKASADQLIIGYAKTFNIPYIILRLANNYGVNQYPEKLIPKSFELLSNGKKITQYGTGENKRYWLHALDTSLAIKKIIDVISNNPKDRHKYINKVYNITSDLVLENKDVINYIIAYFINRTNSSDSSFLSVSNIDNINKYKTIVPERKREDKMYKINDSLFRETFNWKPLINTKSDFLNQLRQMAKLY